jgi:toxin-antitoxin system PIN domain toxin
MIALDANILVYAHRSDSPFFEAAQECVRDLAQGRATWAIPWPCIHEFYGIVTHLRRYVPPSTPAQACDQIGQWLGSPSLRLLGETSGHWDLLSGMLQPAKISGALVHDARVAAICLQHGVREFWTADRDFSRFPQLNCRNPLIH